MLVERLFERPLPGPGVPSGYGALVLPTAGYAGLVASRGFYARRPGVRAWRAR